MLHAKAAFLNGGPVCEFRLSQRRTKTSSAAALIPSRASSASACSTNLLYVVLTHSTDTLVSAHALVCACVRVGKRVREWANEFVGE